MTIWTGKEVARYIEQPPEVKINPNGVDVRASEVWMLKPKTIATLHGDTRKVEPPMVKLEPNKEGFYILKEGFYQVRFANKVTIPPHAVGFCFPRTSLNRLGMIKSETGLWDSGYSGFGTQSVYVAVNEFRIHKDECWFQFTLMDMKEEVDHLYKGHWQGERPAMASGPGQRPGEKPEAKK